MRCEHHTVRLETGSGICLVNVTDRLRELVSHSGLRDGFVTVTSRHTTTAVTINEDERRLHDDVRDFFTRLAPPDARYRHNDIHLRDCPPEEPENAHSHLLAMLLGSSEVVPVSAGSLALGTWQSVFLVELDGPRERTFAVQLVGDWR
jgi:secondary thiamine-phosphate synthase enzyme